MINVNKIASAVKVARSDQQQMAKAVNQSQQDLQAKSTQLNQLVEFKQEYEHRLEQTAGQGIEARQLQDYRLFLDKLNQAIDQQQQALVQSEEALGETRAKWIEKNQRQSALEGLVEKSVREQQRANEQAEQKVADEMSLAKLMVKQAEHY